MQFKNRIKAYITLGLIIGILGVLTIEKGITYTSTDAFCNRCHAHPQATMSWKRSSHFDNKKGIAVHCVQCHLPPEGIKYLTEKTRTGLRDVYSSVFRDSSKINWIEKSTTEGAARHTFVSSCMACHQNIFPIGLTKEGQEAHLYYARAKNEIACTNCHLNVGHYNPNALHAKNVNFGQVSESKGTIYSTAATLEKFENFTETVPGTSVSFDMVAIPGGSFKIGSPDEEPYRKTDEGPQREVKISPFFMGKIEVSWDEYLTFFSKTSGERKLSVTEFDNKTPDAITGPTPPYGAPDQGWGKGKHPAITMTWYAAEVYCKWLSKLTGKNYRLPTEAEWEYAARAGTHGGYYFKANPSKLTSKSLKNRIFGRDTSVINSNIVYSENSKDKTREPGQMQPNPFGLVNMLGNVAEFCSDWYAENAYNSYPEGIITDPKGPLSGTEKVIRGGYFRSDASDVRCAFRDHTFTGNWMKTDPQMPKSKWWYSDCNFVGFRVVCESLPARVENSKSSSLSKSRVWTPRQAPGP
jgi:sulfatase modifying factor 1